MITEIRCRLIVGGACLLSVAAAPALIITSPTAAQTASADPDQVIRHAVVTADDVYIRSGPADSYYPFGKAHTGQVVKVLGDKFNWARIAAEGPAFKSLYGYVKVPRSQEASKLRISPDGRTGTALGRVDIVAPNLNAKNDPSASWKSLLRLQPDEQVVILGKSETERDIIYQVALPKAVNGWITAAYLRDATADEIRAFAGAPGATTLAQGPPAKATGPAPKETRPPSDTPAGQVAAAAPPRPQPADVEKPATVDPAPALQPGAPVEVIPTDTAVAQAPTGPPAAETSGAATSEVLASNAASSPPEEKAAESPSPSDLPIEDALRELESKFEQLLSEPMETAEVLPLRGLFLELAERAEGEAPATARYSRARAEQLAIWADLQQQRQELMKLRTRVKMSAEEAEAVRLALETRRGYTAVGRVVASTIFDGRRLPRLMRLQEPGSGRTVAYLKPTRAFDLAEMVDQLVGVIGEKEFDEGLRLNIVRPTRIDLLAPRR